MSDLVKILLIVMPVVVFLFLRQVLSKFWFKMSVSLFLILISIITVLNIGKYVYSHSHQPPEWDFLVFWLDGNVALRGENFYNPASYQAMTLPYDPGEGFRIEILDVGFKYPPFTMFLLIPLGFLEIGQAYLFWEAAAFIFCLGCVYLLWRNFLKDSGILGLLLIFTLFIRLTPTRNTFLLAQTNFILLFFFLLFWQNRANLWGGVWLALCVVVKPYMALLYLYPLLQRNWKMLLAAVSSLLIASLISILAFGFDTFISFLSNTAFRAPDFLYTEAVNQSLLATILRLTNYQANGSLLLNPLYLGIAFALAITTLAVYFKTKDIGGDWSILTLLFLAMIVYPATLDHYSVMIILPITLLFKHGNENSILGIIGFVYIVAVFMLTGVETGNYTFMANLISWLLCMVYSTGIVEKLAANRGFQPRLSF